MGTGRVSLFVRLYILYFNISRAVTDPETIFAGHGKCDVSLKLGFQV